MQIIHLHRFVTQEHLAMNVFINFQIKRSTCKTVLVTGKQSTCTHVPTKKICVHVILYLSITMSAAIQYLQEVEWGI